jgi:hypothetical protein
MAKVVQVGKFQIILAASVVKIDAKPALGNPQVEPITLIIIVAEEEKEPGPTAMLLELSKRDALRLKTSVVEIPDGLKV